MLGSGVDYPAIISLLSSPRSGWIFEYLYDSCLSYGCHNQPFGMNKQISLTASLDMFLPIKIIEGVGTDLFSSQDGFGSQYRVNLHLY